MLLVYRYRIQSLTGLLNRQASAVDFVFNDCNDRQKDALQLGRQWLSGFDPLGCSDCGAEHDRDVYAARNILSKFATGSGQATPAEGSPVPRVAEDVNPNPPLKAPPATPGNVGVRGRRRGRRRARARRRSYG
jgi:hypothetical protein